MSPRRNATRTTLIVCGTAVALGVVLVITLAMLGAHSLTVGVVGVVTGACIGGAPPLVIAAMHRDRTVRASTLLWRNGAYAYQDWIYRSLRDGKWTQSPVADDFDRHLEDIAHVLDWEAWQAVAAAQRHIRRLLVRAEPERASDQDAKLVNVG